MPFFPRLSTAVAGRAESLAIAGAAAMTWYSPIHYAVGVPGTLLGRADERGHMPVEIPQRSVSCHAMMCYSFPQTTAERHQERPLCCV